MVKFPSSKHKKPVKIVLPMSHRNTYCALFEAIGYTYGGEGDTFKVPDPRGLFLRCLDAGRGIDPGRALGSVQQSGAPNITGRFGATDLTWLVYNHPSSYMTYLKEVGALFGVPTDFIWAATGNQCAKGLSADIGLDASRCSSVYQEGLTEVRPDNLAVNIIIKY